MDQEPVIRPMVKKTLVCQKTERVPEFFDLAFRYATSGRPGPVYLEIPVDVLNGTVERDRVKKLGTQVTSRTTDPGKAGEMLSMMASATNPVVIAGTGVWQSQAEEELVKFIESTGMPVFTSLSGRGTIADNHPLCFEGALAIRPGGALLKWL